jgi:hypothetical protein
MLGALLLAGKAVVGHFADKRLHEPVLAALGRPRVIFQVEQLEFDESAQFAFQRFGRLVAQPDDAVEGESLAQNRTALAEVGPTPVPRTGHGQAGCGRSHRR